MKKILIYLGYLSAILLIGLFSSLIFQRVYFNDFKYEVPNLQGKTMEEATEILKGSTLKLKNEGERYSSRPAGEIFLQEPKPESHVKSRRSILVWVSKGAKLIEIEELVGMNLLKAKEIVESKGLVVDRVIYIPYKASFNEVLSTDPSSNDLLNKGDTISFLVSGTASQTGSVEIFFPDIIGKTLEEAKEIIEDNNLVLGKISKGDSENIEPDIVIKSTPMSGRKISSGSRIDLTVSK